MEGGARLHGLTEKAFGRKYPADVKRGTDVWMYIIQFFLSYQTDHDTKETRHHCHCQTLVFSTRSAMES